MNPHESPFAVVYNAWAEIFRSLIPGGSETPPAVAAPKPAQVAAEQEWEDEGGSVKPDKKPGLAAVPKIPF